jgi:hypothetical protein
MAGHFRGDSFFMGKFGGLPAQRVARLPGEMLTGLESLNRDRGGDIAFTSLLSQRRCPKVAVPLRCDALQKNWMLAYH